MDARPTMLRKYQKKCHDAVGWACGEIKWVDLDNPKESEFYHRKQHKVNGKRGGSFVHPESVCKECRKRRVRETRNEERAKIIRARWAAKNQKKVRKYKRDYDRRRRAKEKGLVPIRPFAEWLIQFYKDTADVGDWIGVGQRGRRWRRRYNAAHLSKMLGLEKHYVMDLLLGKRLTNTIELDKLDSFFTQVGHNHMLSILYPLSQEEEEEEDAA